MISTRGIAPKGLSALTMLAALAACAQQPADEETTVEEAQEAADSGETAETISILRTEIEEPQLEEPPLETLEAVIAFPEGGADLDEAAIAALRAVAETDQLALNGPIILRGHSDAGGTDSANMRAANRRAEAVKDWLVEDGVDAARVQIIAFGEQNPVEPNALPDGTANEAGRAANRRVEIEIPALVLTVSTTDDPDGETPPSEISD